MSRIVPLLLLFLFSFTPVYAQSVRITEFLTTNVNGIVDENNTHQGWIEIWNYSVQTLANPSGRATLSGCKLTNGTTVWTVPTIDLAPDERMIIWASGKNRTAVTAPLHTSFTLPPGGGTLTLQNSGGTAISSFTYPAQQPDVSWGRDETDTGVVATVQGSYTEPTPGERNNYSGPGVAGKVIFDKTSRAFSGSLTVTLTEATPAPGAQIRYTINGALPNASSPVYTAPLTLTSTQTQRIRARVFQSGLLPGETETQSFIALGSTTANFTSTMPIVVLSTFSVPVNSNQADPTDQEVYVWVWEPAAADGIARFSNPPTLMSRAAIDRRGSSTFGNPKFNLNMEFRKARDDDDRNQPFLGMPSHSDWVLGAPYEYDRSLLHNTFAYAMSRAVGRYAPRIKPAEVFVDATGGALDMTTGQSGDYFGIYEVTEKIRRDKNRVDVSPLNMYDNGPVTKTGGYIFKVDRLDAGDGGFSAGGQTMAYYYPKEVEIRAPQRDPQEQYLSQYITSFNSALQGVNFKDPVLGYAAWIDVPEAIDHHLLNVWPLNLDAFRLSGYWHKERGGKLIPGPVWDYDRTMFSTDSRDGFATQWRSPVSDFGTDFFNYTWWNRMFQDIDFYQKYIDRWQDLRRGALSKESVNALLDSLNAKMSAQAIARDLARWGKTKRSWTNYAGQTFPAGQAAEVQRIKDFMQRRAEFMDGPRDPVASNPQPQWIAPVNASIPEGNVASGTQVTLTGPINTASATIYYTLDGADPRPVGGGAPAAGVLTYNGTPITITATTRLRARAYDPSWTALTGANNPPLVSKWSGLTNLRYAVDAPVGLNQLAVTEISYHPTGPTAPELSGNPLYDEKDFEFIELKNVGNTTIDLGGAQFTAGVNFTFAGANAISLAPGAYIVVVSNPTAFAARYGTSVPVVGPWTGDLSNTGEQLVIKAANGTVLLDFTYSDALFSWTDGSGATLEYIGTSYTSADYNNPANWRQGSEVGGTPGAPGSGPGAAIVINEVLSNSTLPRVDAIELYNPTANPVDVSNWYISDTGNAASADEYKQFKIPAGTVIPAGGYQVFTEVNFNPNGPWNPTPGTRGAGEFAFDADHGDDAWLIEADGTGRLVRFIDHVQFGAARADESWGRWPNGTGGLYPMAQRTLLDEASPNVPRPGLGAPNSVPRVGPIVISEVQHTPPGDNVNFEYVEIYNPTAVEQPLAQWRLRGAVDFDFTSGTLAPGGTIVVTSFDPTDADKVNAFRAFYNLSANSSVPLAGPWVAGDRLTGAGTVMLYRAEPPPVLEPYYYPLTLEDETNYLSTGLWPAAQDGLSLSRVLPAEPGDLPTSWNEVLATPGRPFNTDPDTVVDNLHVPLSAGALTLDVRANDTDLDNDNLLITSVGTPSNGSATTDGALISYLPAAGYNGNDQFTYTISDYFGGTAEGTVNLVNAAPVGVADVLHVPFTGSELTLAVLANDTDADNDSLTIVSIDPASNGTVATDGSVITYTPGPNYRGFDQFSYSIKDGYGGTATATVNLVNAVPVAVADVYHPTLQAALNLDVQANDRDNNDDPRTIVAVTDGLHGTVQTDGSMVTYTPGLGYEGGDSFTYTISDGHGATSTGTVTLVNSKPVATNDVVNSHGEQVTVTVLGNDSDADLDPLVISGVTNGSGGTVAINGATIVYTPGPGYTGDDSFSYTVSDGHGGFATGVVTVSANGPFARTEAATGSQVPGAPGMTYKSLQVPAIGDDQFVAFIADAKGSVIRKKTYLVGGNPAAALYGVGDAVPGAPGLKFTKFGAPLCDDDGRIVMIAGISGAGVSKKTGSAIVATEPGGATTLIARLGGLAQDVPGGTLSKFSALDASGGETLYVADLANRLGTGVWAWDSSSTSLVVREGTVVTTAAGARSISDISLLGAVPGSAGHDRSHRAGEVAMRLTFSDKTSGVGLATRNGSAWSTSVKYVSGMSTGFGGTWKSFGPVALAAPGSVVSLATLSGVAASSDSALVLLTDSAATKIAGEGEASPIQGVTYKSFSDPVANQNGEIAFTAELQGAGVTKSNAAALFLRNAEGDVANIARLGDAAVGIPGATWKRFVSFALPSGEASGVVVLAEVTGAGVNKKNNLGLWAQDSSGALTLLARTGSPIPGSNSSQVLSKLVLLNALPPTQGSARSFSDTGKVTFLATFTDRSQSIQVVRIP